MNEIFLSIQGEGPAIGQPAIFVRTANCNLRCQWCLIGSTRVAGPKRRAIRDLRPGHIVYAYDGEKIVRDEVERVTSHKVPASEVLEIVTDKGNVYATREHRFWVDNNWKAAASLRVGNRIHDIPKEWIQSDKMKGVANPVHGIDPKTLAERAIILFRGRLVAASTRRKMSLVKKLWNPMRDIPSVAARQGIANSKRYESGENVHWRYQMSPEQLGRINARSSRLHKKLWRSLSVRERASRIRRLQKGRELTVSKCEMVVATIFEGSGLPIVHTGGKASRPVVTLSGRSLYPDFRVKGQKKVIEVFQANSFGRGKGWAKKRVAAYRSAGYECLMIEGLRLFHSTKGISVPRVRHILREVTRFVMNSATVRLVRPISPKQAARMGNGRRGGGGRLDSVEVFDLTTKKHHTFFANGLLTHNCDTRYSWDWANYDRSREEVEMDPRTVVGAILKLSKEVTMNWRPLVVVTGGEPLLQTSSIVQIVHDLTDRIGFYDLDIETAGTIPLSDTLASKARNIVVSPKLGNSQNSLAARFRPEILAQYVARPKAVFKFVVDTPGDLEEIEGWLCSFPAIDWRRIYLMPQGQNATEVAEKSRWVAEAARNRGWRYTPRLQLSLFGATRGT